MCHTALTRQLVHQDRKVLGMWSSGPLGLRRASCSSCSRSPSLVGQKRMPKRFVSRAERSGGITRHCHESAERGDGRLYKGLGGGIADHLLGIGFRSLPCETFHSVSDLSSVASSFRSEALSERSDRPPYWDCAMISCSWIEIAQEQRCLPRFVQMLLAIASCGVTVTAPLFGRCRERQTRS
jgi:hypothetical protein